MTDKEKELQAEAIGYYRKRIAELEMTVGTLRNFSNEQATCIERLEKENAELKSIAEFQQSSNMSRHFENKKLKEGLAVGSMWNKHLNSQNKALEEERDKYRDMTFEQREQLTKAKEIIKSLLQSFYGWETEVEFDEIDNSRIEQAGQFLSEVEK